MSQIVLRSGPDLFAGFELYWKSWGYRRPSELKIPLRKADPPNGSRANGEPPPLSPTRPSNRKNSNALLMQDFIH